MSKVFGFGSAAVDFRIRVPEMGEGYKEKLLAQEVRALGGGAMANCLTQLVRLGGRAVWLGKLGIDWIADTIIEQMEQEGIDCTCVIRDAALCSPFNIAVYAGERNRRVGGFLLPNSLAALQESDLKELARKINATDWVVIELGEIPIDKVLKFCLLAKDRGAYIAVDVDLDPVLQCNADLGQVEQIFVLADVLIPNLTAVQSIFSEESPKKLAESMSRKYKTVTVVTAGADGAYYCIPERGALHQEAEPVEVVDTVGAGDAFHGGLLFALSHHWPLDEAVRLAVRCGAMNCTKFGARTGMPFAADLGIDHSFNIHMNIPVKKEVENDAKITPSTEVK